MFEKQGYFKEYYINGKYIGTENYVKKDRDVMGFFGMKEETLTETITFKNNKSIKKNTIVKTQLQILCSKMK